MRTILLIEDDPTTQAIVRGVVKDEASLTVCSSLAEANKFIEQEKIPDLIIVDRSLPDGDGISFCTYLRADERLNEIPVIFLTGKTSESDKISGFFAGADDYITKPFNPLELKARINARFRIGLKKVHLGDVTIDISSHRVFIQKDQKQQEIELTRIEFKLLLILSQTMDKLFSRNELLDKVWGTATNLSDRVVDTHISHLRKKIKDSNLSIDALRGEGYRITVKETHAA